MKFSTLFATTVFLAGTTVSAQLYNSFINCISPEKVPAGSINAAGSISSDECVTQCSYTTLKYAYFTTSSNLPGTTAGQSACVCSGTQPPITGFTRTVDTLDDYSCNTPTDFQAFLLRTTNRFDGCSRGGNDRGPLKNGIQGTFEQCLTYCVDYDTIYLQALVSSDAVSCWCQTGAFPVKTRCGTGDENNYYTTYRRTAGAVSSAGLRKRTEGTVCETAQTGGLCDSSIHRDLGQTLRVQKFCPAGLTACNVDGQPGAYECIDTNNELESCGGCVAGEFGKEDSASGMNCQTEFPRSIRSRVTCSSGACLLY